jgi:hypothetical protein
MYYVSMSAIPVFLKSQRSAVDRPTHSSSKTLALLVLASSTARWTDEKKTAIQLLTMETWRAVKDRIRKVPLVNRRIPVVIDTGEHRCMMLSYPPMGQESDARRRQKELWRGATRF